MKGIVRLISTAGFTAAMILALAAMPAGEFARRMLDGAGQALGLVPEPEAPKPTRLASTWMGSRHALSASVEAEAQGAVVDRSVIELAWMIAREVESREGRNGILPFGPMVSGAASQGGNGGDALAGNSREGGLGTAGSMWAALSLGALMLMTRRWQ